MQAQLGIPPRQQILTSGAGQKMSLREYLESDPGEFHVDEAVDTVSLQAASLRSGETVSTASRRILSRMGVLGRRV